MTTELIRGTQPDASLEPIDPALLQAIRPSATRMAASEGTFIYRLHEEIGPLVHQLPDEGWPFCERTARAILWVALSDPPVEAVSRSLRWLGEANQADGFPRSEYVSIGQALVRIARDVSGTKWTSTIGSAWIRYFMWLQPHIQADALRQEAARLEAAHQEARLEAARQEAAARQQAADYETVQRSVFEQASRRAINEIDVFAVAPRRNDGEGPVLGYGETMPDLTALDREQ